VNIRIGVLADMHINAMEKTAQERGLEWALKELSGESCDVVVMAGDASSNGSAAAVRRVLEKMNSLHAPLVLTPGNADLRTPDDHDEVRELLTTRNPVIVNGFTIMSVDSSDKRIRVAEVSGNALSNASPGKVVIVTHHSPDLLEGEGRGWMETVLDSGAVSLVIAGHHHRDLVSSSGTASIHNFRGLDPDKANGGPPAYALLESDGDEWLRRDVPFPDGDIRTWPLEDKREFIDYLGFSCMGDSMNGLDRACAGNVHSIELKCGGALSVRRDKLCGAVERWRRSGGRFLSIHMPDCPCGMKTHNERNIENWDSAMQMACELNADAMTVHVPRIAVGRMRPGSETWKACVETMCRSLAPAVERGIGVGIENLRIKPQEVPDGSRMFGYLPEECLGLVYALREKSGYPNIGICLDIGHARNNGPFASKYTLGVWYAMTGSEVLWYHVHQVVDGVNHNPLRNVFGPLISLSSFFLDWKNGGLNHAPVLLEIRGRDEGIGNLDYLKGFIEGADGIGKNDRSIAD